MKLSKIVKLICEAFISLPNSLGISRSDMPQIPTDRLESFLQHLKDTGHDYESVELSADELTPSQGELDTDKADKIWADGKAFETPIIISADKYVLDGTHRWFAVKRNAPNEKISCIMLSDNAKPALAAMLNFSGVEKKDLLDRVVEAWQDTLNAEQKDYVKANKKYIKPKDLKLFFDAVAKKFGSDKVIYSKSSSTSVEHKGKNWIYFPQNNSWFSKSEDDEEIPY